MDLLSLVFTLVVESLMVPVKRHGGYLISCTKYMRNMRTKKTMLDASKVDVSNQRDHYNRNSLVIPCDVSPWLEEVEKINARMETIPGDVSSCFNFKVRHNLGRKAFKITQDIDSLLERKSRIIWTDLRVPLGKVDSQKASTSTASSHHNDFESREKIFLEALEALGPDHKSHMIALCGMGGVGKTTMMKKLKKVVIEKKFFNFIIEAVVSEKPDLKLIQQAVASHLAINLEEKDPEQVRASKLRKGFETTSDGGKKKFLIMLDDVWQPFNLHDIGLSPLPNQGVDFKVLLTSRNRHVCTIMRVEVSSILNVEILKDLEAHEFFRGIVKIPEADRDLHKIGADIVRRCHGLPMAIKTIAHTLMINSSKQVWEDTCSRLKHRNIDGVLHQIFEISYNNLEDEETRSTLLLCGLFPEDFDTPMEDLVRYGWALKLFKRVDTIMEARNRLNHCILRLINANLLMESGDDWCVKLHDLVRTFVLEMCSKDEHVSFVGNMSNWPSKDTSESCKMISSTCTDRTEFPIDCKYPNLLLLKLMHGDESFRFPKDFYAEMDKLKVIAYEKIVYPLLPTSPQCSTNLQTLCLHKCSLMFDWSVGIGDLLNLEVLSLAHCRIQKLPSTIGNLKKLKLLDLTGCINLLIDDCVLKNLVNLEELYMRVARDGRLKDVEKAIRLTHANVDELEHCSPNLVTLEIEFFDRKNLPMNLSLKKLQKFKISMGCLFDGDDNKINYSTRNSLLLATNRNAVFKSRLNELLEKTEVLGLQVDDIHDLEDIEVVPSRSLEYSSFHKLRSLVVNQCVKLRYLFTLHVAKALSKLEHLKISSCDYMEEVIHIKSSESETIQFPKLKFLYLSKLPTLLNLCNVANVIKLPQLMELQLDGLPNFTSIYPQNKLAISSMFSSNISADQHFLDEKVVIPKLETLIIHNMKNLKEIWPRQFEEVNVCVLRVIRVMKCDSLVNMFPTNPMPFIRHLEEIDVRDCGSIEVLFNMDLGCVDGVIQHGVSSSLRSIQVGELRKLTEVWRIKNSGLHNVVGDFEAVESLEIRDCKRFRNVFTPTTTNFEMKALTKVLMHGCGEEESDESEQEFSQVDIVHWSLCQYSTEIRISDCNALSSVIPTYAVGKMQKLEELKIKYCRSMVEVFETQMMNNNGGCGSDVDDESGGTSAILTIPTVKNIHVPRLSNLNNLEIHDCELLQHVFTFSMLESLGKLEKLSIQKCNAMKMIVKDENGEQTPTSKVVEFPCLKSIELIRLPSLEGFFLGMKHEFQWPLLDHVMIDDCPKMMVFTSGCSITPRLKFIHTGLGKHSSPECGLNFDQTAFSSSSSCTTTTSQGIPWLSFHNLIKMDVHGNHHGKKIIPFNEFQQLQKLEKICVVACDLVEEVFEALEETGSSGLNELPSVVTFSKLREMKLHWLKSLKYIWKNNRWMVFQFPNLTKLSITGCKRLKHVFTTSMVGSLLQLQELFIEDCEYMDVIVNEEEESDGKLANNEMITFPCLKSLSLYDLPRLEGFCLRNEDFSWPLLDSLEIIECLAIKVFTKGYSTTPKLKVIDTSFGRCYVREDLNSIIKTTQEEGFQW